MGFLVPGDAAMENDTTGLIHGVLGLAEQAFQPGYKYLKAKVTATELSPACEVQGDLFAASAELKSEIG